MAFFTKTSLFAVPARVSPAFMAAIALVVIQVGMGIVFKISQRAEGGYAFSQSSSLTISEFCKCCLSTLFFYNECRRDRRKQTAIDTETLLHDQDRYEDRKEDLELASSARSSTESPTTSKHLPWNSVGVEEDNVPGPSRVGCNAPGGMFINRVGQEIQVQTVYGMAHLALLYAVINNSIFVLFRLADPGTISLVKSGVTLITAVTLFLTTGQQIVKRQWLAICFQLCGVVITQYHAESGSLYPFPTYLLLIFQTTVGAVAGVYNQLILKAEPGSLHVCNMALYASGAIINVSIHLGSRILDPEEPTFFEGYNSISAGMVIMSNIFIGLAITAVYKYSDALVKCFATAVSTGILLYIAPIIFQVPLSFLVIPGTLTVFAATYLYVDSAPPKVATSSEWRAAEVDDETSAKKTFMSTAFSYMQLFTPRGSLRIVGLCTATIVAFSTILVLAGFKTSISAVNSTTGVPLIASPFENSLAFVRWNRPLPQRIPQIMAYEPFFKQIHISMPDYLKSSDDRECTNPFAKECSESLFNDLGGDNYKGTMLIYANVAQTMQSILDAPAGTNASVIDGLMYYHFDAWLDPMAFQTEDKRKIWFPDAGGPRWECMTNESSYDPWWGIKNNYHRASINATTDLVPHLDAALRHRIDPKEFCIGWSDIYWIPRHYFKDYIFLARFFFKHRVMHEVAIPTMIRILDLMRRTNEINRDEVLTRLSDCWGSCCSANPHAEDVLWHRCGHKLNYTATDNVTQLFYAHLASRQAKLGTAMYNESLSQLPGEAETIYEEESEVVPR